MVPSTLKPLFDYLDACQEPVNLAQLEALLKSCPITRNDLKEFIQFNENTYRRNRIRMSDWYECLVLCWKPGQKSYIHDHQGSSCCFKVIEGTALEMICARTGRSAELPLVRPIDSRTLEAGIVCGSLSAHIHEVINPSQTHDLITLHIYSPPLNMQIYEYDEQAQETYCPEGRVLEYCI
ncbi:MAG TPA: cysteine dioxygenase family protein [Gemmatales bacterium]|nr:cysteine dioxygenase family protein [Gemmatales bacterium]HMP16195.1 cysteine dioxygenase family protein [Gemmatales bacterium]